MAIQSFFESYGWYIVFGVAISAFVYSKFVSPALTEFFENKKIENQKKFDSRMDDVYGDNVKRAREKLQEKYQADAARSKDMKEEEKRKKVIEAKDQEDEAEGRLGGANDVELYVRNTINTNKIVIFSKTYCPFCRKAKVALSNYQPAYVAIELDEHKRGDAIQFNLHKITGVRTVPQVFINGQFIGGGDDTVAAHHSGKLASLL
ncbi:hypothetical protein QR680_014950 [Steinernema hermaphroditum]|uniref:Glutaredoxin-2, mitochondrial n=1 Tax=Steinernema hermaphroditum TaxID=289476 RepID=A0AA39IAL2_9BILA|nr:hypothetical protein QR680_014950 [Steinernema hermaphroditum]